MIEIGVRLGQQGSLRPEAFVRSALEYSEARASAFVVTRTALLEEHSGCLHDPLE